MKPIRIFTRLYLTFLLLAVAIGTAVRMALCLHPLTVASELSWWQWILTFLLGAVNDAAVMAVMFIPLGCFLMSSGWWKTRSPQRWWLMGVLTALWVWITWGWRALAEFNEPLRNILSGVIVFWILSFALRTFVPSIRRWWMRVWTAIIIGVYLAVMVLNACGEWLFWDEFGVRYNFIAVDYLVYTSEVVGNIMQSYSMGWIITGVLAMTIALEWALFGNAIKHSSELHVSGWRRRSLLVWLLPAAVGAGLLPVTEKAQHTECVWYNQLQASGAYSFVQAFFMNELAYDDFYLPVTDDYMNSTASEALAAQATTDSVAPLHPNIVLITMESMGCDYMARYGDTRQLTPRLDSLANMSLTFDRLYAAGNRTVRGLEALTLCRPPAPGESVIKRPGSREYPSIASTLSKEGYECTFMYGGDSYFDNMGPFFSSLGYNILDKTNMDTKGITCQTVWGVCDGDVYNRLLNYLDHRSDGKPAFVHLMTTSNHRPYIYPEGCVSIPPTAKSRRGAVMYSDYALGEFIDKASERPWFGNTVFVLVADHCSSSAGSTELPLENYHIPAMVYAPWLLAPEAIATTSSQIDLMPTVLRRLHWPLDTLLYGRDILADDYQSRAFIATYQDLGYLQNDTLTVLSPGSKVRQFVVEPTSDNPYAMRPLDSPSPSHANRAAALYRHSSR